MDGANRKENAAAKAALGNQGIQFLVPAAADRAAWEQTTEKASLELGKEGFFTKGMVPKVRNLVLEYRKLKPQASP